MTRYQSQPFVHAGPDRPHENTFTHAGVTVVPAREEHLAGAVAAIRSVRAVHPYPSVEEVPEPNDIALAEWLTTGPNIGRWVALVGDEVIGHIQVCDARQYLSEHLNFNKAAIGEVSKLFVSPEYGHHGAGRMLLTTACDYIWAIRRTPALVVAATGHAAIELYRQSGLVTIGEFDEIHGRKLVMIAEKTASPHHSLTRYNPNLNNPPDPSRLTRTTAMHCN